MRIVTEIHDLSVTDLTAAIRRRELSPVQITAHYLDRMERLNATVGAFFTITAERAVDQAAAAEKAVARAEDPAALPPLTGVPIPIKDLNMVAGVRQTLGSAVFADNVPDVDDHVSAALRAAGAVLTGKTATPEFGLPCYTETAVGPPARTPWDLNRSAGGSSGGAAAAVAAGLAPAAQGSDGGGSIRIPSSVCGLYGIKPTRGRISGAPLVPDLFGLGTDGPIARTVADAALLLDVMTGNQPGDMYTQPPLPAGETFLGYASRPPGRLRIGRTLHHPIGDGTVHPDCAAAYQDASELLAGLGHEVVDLDSPFGPDTVPPFEALWYAHATLAPVDPAQEEQLLPFTRYMRERGRQVTRGTAHPGPGLPPVHGPCRAGRAERLRRRADPDPGRAAGPGRLLRGGPAAGELRAAEAVRPVRRHVQRVRAARGERAAVLELRGAADRHHAGWPDGRGGHPDLAVRPARVGPAVAGPSSRAVVASQNGDMTLGRRASRLAWRVVRVLIPLLVSGVLLGVLAFGYGPVPALGPALDPGRGVWTSASGAALPTSGTLTLPGLAHPVQVSFSSHGVPSVRGADSRDLFLALGYLHAKFRLTEMDLERRLGEGRLAQLAGPAAVGSDKFELRLGLLRTAQQEWAQLPRSSPAAQALLAYSRGVNDYLAQTRQDGQWPALFSLAGVYPASWTPVDSLVIQGDLTQELDFTTTPLDYALLDRTLGTARTMAWFPILPPNQQHPYDPGPYRKAGLAPISGQPALTAARTPAPARTPARTPAAAAPQRIPQAEAAAAAALLKQVAALPAGQVHGGPDSNAWAANGPLVARPARHAGRRSAPAADHPIGLVPGGAVRSRLLGQRGQRARPAQRADRA